MNGGALASAAEEKPNEEFGVSSVEATLKQSNSIGSAEVSCEAIIIDHCVTRVKCYKVVIALFWGS